MGSAEKPARDRLQAWVEDLTQRLEPERIQIPPGRTLAEAVELLLVEEELGVRSSAENDLRGAKLEVIRRLREQFVGVTEPDRLGDSLFEMVLDDLDTITLARLADVLGIWTRIVADVGSRQQIPRFDLASYMPVQMRLNEDSPDTELVLGFRGTSEMVRRFRDYLREIGLQEK